MRGDRPSFTAAAVAFARGAHPERDPIARALVPRGFAIALDAIEAAGPAQPLAERLARVGSLGLIDHLQLRTAAIDSALLDALDAGARQLVILGAGLDARAFRIERLAEIPAFEVDHPSTQRYKRERVAGLQPCAREVRFVPVDFERQRVGEELARAGHDAGTPTFWIWEGVTQYLHREAMRATLHEVAARSAPGSRIAITYSTPSLIARAGPVAVLAARGIFRALGEPILGAIEPDELAHEVRDAGFEVIEDSGTDDWARRHGEFSARLGRLWGAERLVVCARS